MIRFCDTTSSSIEIQEGIINIIKKGTFISGEEVGLFEREFASFIGKRHCIGVANGTDALEIALESLQLPENSRVLVQGNTYIATALSVKNQSKTYSLDLVDVDKSCMIDTNDLLKKVKDTRVLIITHLYGFMPDMDKIIKICQDNNIYLIEDCAQAHGATWMGKRAGSFGTLSCFSFYPTKNLGAFGDGGAVLTDDPNLSGWIRKRANMGSIIKNEFEIIGRNSRLDTIQAFVLSQKLKSLNNDNNKRRKIAQLYNYLLKDIPEIDILKNNDVCEPVYHLYVIRTKKRDQLKQFLTENQIPTMIHYPTCISKTPAFLPFHYDTPVSDELSREILSLPMYPAFINSFDHIVYICEKIREFYKVSLFKPESLCSRKVPDKMGVLHFANDEHLGMVRRLFYVDGFETSEIPVVRGNHSNKNTNESMNIIDGLVLLEIESKYGNVEKIILRKNDRYLIPKDTWIRYFVLDTCTKILVLCDKTFEESIVETDYQCFRSIPSNSLSSEQV